MIQYLKLWVRTRLVDDAADWWRWWSVRLLALAAALQAINLSSPDSLVVFWQSVPPGLRGALPPWLDELITLALMLAALIARHVKQPAPPRGVTE